MAAALRASLLRDAASLRDSVAERALFRLYAKLVWPKKNKPGGDAMEMLTFREIATICDARHRANKRLSTGAAHALGKLIEEMHQNLDQGTYEPEEGIIDKYSDAGLLDPCVIEAIVAVLRHHVQGSSFRGVEFLGKLLYMKIIATPQDGITRDDVKLMSDCLVQNEIDDGSGFMVLTMIDNTIAALGDLVWKKRLLLQDEKNGCANPMVLDKRVLAAMEQGDEELFGGDDIDMYMSILVKAVDRMPLEDYDQDLFDGRDAAFLCLLALKNSKLSSEDMKKGHIDSIVECITNATLEEFSTEQEESDYSEMTWQLSRWQLLRRLRDVNRAASVVSSDLIDTVFVRRLNADVVQKAPLLKMMARCLRERPDVRMAELVASVITSCVEFQVAALKEHKAHKNSAQDTPTVLQTVYTRLRDVGATGDDEVAPSVRCGVLPNVKSLIKRCGACSKYRADKKMMCCAACALSWYCDSKCQKQDWYAGHKHVCVKK